MSSEDDDDMDYCPDYTSKGMDRAVNVNSIPALSKHKYEKAYEDFQKWNKSNGEKPVTQNVLMKYFTEMGEKSKPSTLGAYYSMLKATLRLNDNIDITPWTKILDYLKRKNAGYKPVRATCFTENELETFLNEAPDDQWLDVKVVCVFSLNGAHSGHRLVSIKVEHIKEYENYFWVVIPNAEIKQSFTITGSFFTIVKRYAALRPKMTVTNRFFLHYNEGKCLTTPMGHNQFYKMPRRIAQYLNLPKPEQYGGTSFRIPTATEFLARQSLRIATSTKEISNSNRTGDQKQYDEFDPEQSVEYSLDYETGLMKTSSVNFKTPSISAASNSNDATEHMCTGNCSFVKCNNEDNEKNVLHAFSIVKPSDYAITEVIPAQFSSDPPCRWMVAYSHFMEPVTSFNSEEKFNEITNQLPKNVKVMQKYIRCNSSKLFAAYVVVYGVKCRCQKPIFGAIATKPPDRFRKRQGDSLSKQPSVALKKPNYDPLSAQPMDSDEFCFSINDIKQET